MAETPRQTSKRTTPAKVQPPPTLKVEEKKQVESKEIQTAVTPSRKAVLKKTKRGAASAAEKRKGAMESGRKGEIELRSSESEHASDQEEASKRTEKPAVSFGQVENEDLFRDELSRLSRESQETPRGQEQGEGVPIQVIRIPQESTSTPEPFSERSELYSAASYERHEDEILIKEGVSDLSDVELDLSKGPTVESQEEEPINPEEIERPAARASRYVISRPKSVRITEPKKPLSRRASSTSIKAVEDFDVQPTIPMPQTPVKGKRAFIHSAHAGEGRVKSGYPRGHSAGWPPAPAPTPNVCAMCATHGRPSTTMSVQEYIHRQAFDNSQRRLSAPSWSSQWVDDLVQFVQDKRSNKDEQRERVRQNRLFLDWEKQQFSKGKTVIIPVQPVQMPTLDKMLNEIFANISNLSDIQATELIDILSEMPLPDPESAERLKVIEKLKQLEAKGKATKTKFTPFRYISLEFTYSCLNNCFLIDTMFTFAEASVNLGI